MTRFDRILIVAGSAFVLFSLSGIAYQMKPPVLAVSLSALATAAMFAVLAVGLVMLRPTSGGAVRRRLGLAPGRLSWPLVLLAVVGTVTLSNVLEAAIAWLDLSDVGNLARIDKDLEGARGGGLSVALLAVALASGSAEELFFRGYAQRGLERRWAHVPFGPPLALLVGAGAFALAHFDAVHSTAAFVLGLYLGVLTRIADSLWPAIACHVVNNAAAVLDAAFVPALPPAGPVRAALELAFVVATLLVAARLRRPAPAPATPAPLAPDGS
jgi:membrane protease YdiL (CAAX protease family)